MPTRLVPVYDSDGNRVAQVNPDTHDLHHPITGRLLDPKSKHVQSALEALNDHLQEQPRRHRRRAEKAARKELK